MYAVSKDPKVKIMANVAASVKVYADDPNKLGEIRTAIEKFAQIQHVKEEELGFGIKILRLTLLLDDEAGGTEKLEEKIRTVPNVTQVEVETVTRI